VGGGGGGGWRASHGVSQLVESNKCRLRPYRSAELPLSDLSPRETYFLLQKLPSLSKGDGQISMPRAGPRALLAALLESPEEGASALPDRHHRNLSQKAERSYGYTAQRD